MHSQSTLVPQVPITLAAQKRRGLALTLMFPFMSFWTTEKAELPRRSKSLTRPSVASRNSLVWTPPSVGTSAYDCSRQGEIGVEQKKYRIGKRKDRQPAFSPF